MRIIIPLLLTAILAAGCTGDQGARTVPRRTAYPRPELPDTVMAAAQGAPLHFLVNTAATAASEKDGWLNISYPPLGATVFVTFTPTTPAEAAGIKANRMERLMLNSGDHPSEHTEFITAHGFSALMVRTDGISTPVQFIATDDSAWVVSGAVYFNDPNAAEATDSIRPMAEAIAGDVFRALKELQ